MVTPLPALPNSLKGGISSEQKREKLSSRMGSRKETQKQTSKKQKLVTSFNEIVTPMMNCKNYNSEQESEERSEISTEFNVVHQSKIKKRKTSDTSLSSTKSTQISTQLMLFDDTWPIANMPVAKEHFEFEGVGLKKKREMANPKKIAMMKYYSREEEEEERLKGVSTKLTLYTDPWNIKKRLTPSDLGYLCRLLLQTSLVDKYVLQYLSSEEINKVQSKEGLRVMMWDQDTESQHSLILKKWSTSKSYVLIDGWGQKFVNRRDLRAGDDIGLYWDPYTSRFNFHVIQRAASQ
ncbi:putative B3 domain-containing protein At1g78640 [Pistacia vera]|uniref:putative B3 domain-containing protein At1g78640 n=1 Tax=Pistacia vera TaxID=55513 RepID=UPI0012639D18|nr:putative B3 domain-containing protein At1g78640 [Pistacia vera]